jgi:hypothetical protein
MLRASIGALESNRLKDVIKKHQIHGGVVGLEAKVKPSLSLTA